MYIVWVVMSSLGSSDDSNDLSSSECKYEDEDKPDTVKEEDPRDGKKDTMNVPKVSKICKKKNCLKYCSAKSLHAS